MIMILFSICLIDHYDHCYSIFTELMENIK